jgi:phosphoglycolate phosphatase-like HAD superfamily hydrolase
VRNEVLLDGLPLTSTITTKSVPDPEGLLLAMKQAGACPAETFHVGDQAEDTEASRAPKVTAIGSAWGLVDVADLEASKPDRIFKPARELKTFLLKSI